MRSLACEKSKAGGAAKWSALLRIFKSAFKLVSPTLRTFLIDAHPPHVRSSDATNFSALNAQCTSEESISSQRHADFYNRPCAVHYSFTAGPPNKIPPLFPEKSIAVIHNRLLRRFRRAAATKERREIYRRRSVSLQNQFSSGEGLG